MRDVVVSGGDVANVPWKQLETYLMGLLSVPTVRDIRLATKALAGLPQHWLQGDVVEGLNRVAITAERRGVNLAVHTHINHVNSLTPLVARAARMLLEVGVRDVRNQGVLMRGVNATTTDLLDLCFGMQGEAGILPYYFYMCDMIPNAEHWRVPVWYAQQLQHDMMGYLPGYATPRIVCDVPFVGKRWVHMLAEYDREHGISYWTKNYRTSIEATDDEALSASSTPTTTRSTPCPSPARSGGTSRPRNERTAPGFNPGACSWRISLAEGVPDVLAGVLDVLAGLLGVRGGLLRLALGLQTLVVRGVADGLLGLAGQLFGLVLDLVGEAHRQTSRTGGCLPLSLQKWCPEGSFLKRARSARSRRAS